MGKMFKSVITFTAIIALISAQAQTEFPNIEDNFPIVAPVQAPTPSYQNPETEACYNSIKATLMHVKSMAKAFDKAGGLGQLTEALEVFSEAKSAKNACADVPFTQLA